MSPTISVHHSVTLPDGSVLDLTLKPSADSTAEVSQCHQLLVTVEEFVLHGASAPPEREPNPEADPGNSYDRPCPTLIDPPPEGGEIVGVGTRWIPFEDKRSEAGIGYSYQELAELSPGESSVEWREDDGHWLKLPLVHRRISEKTPRMVIGLRRPGGPNAPVMSLMLRCDGEYAVIIKSKTEEAPEPTPTEPGPVVNLRELVQRGLESEGVGVDRIHSWVASQVSPETMPSWYSTSPERLTSRIDRILLAQGIEPPTESLGA